jgi:hypothetical protein
MPFRIQLLDNRLARSCWIPIVDISWILFRFILEDCTFKIAIILFPCQGFVCEGVVGEDVVKLLEKAIQRHPDMDIEVKNTCFIYRHIFLTGPARYYRNFFGREVFFADGLHRYDKK